jgi:hypothetical protein
MAVAIHLAVMFDGKAIAIFRYFVIIILYCKSIHSDFFQQDTFSKRAEQAFYTKYTGK